MPFAEHFTPRANWAEQNSANVWLRASCLLQRAQTLESSRERNRTPHGRLARVAPALTSGITEASGSVAAVAGARSAA